MTNRIFLIIDKTGSPGKVMSFHRIFIYLFLSLIFISLSWLAFVRNVSPESSQTFTQPVFVGVNEAQLSDKWSHEEEIDVQDEDRFHVVTNIILFTHKHYNLNMRYKEMKIPTGNQLLERQQEVEAALQKNLNHEKVAAVHVLYYHPAVQQYLMKLNLKNSKKLILHLTKRDPTIAINLDYIQKFLKHKPVNLMHMDCYLGSGWTDIDFKQLRTERKLYALTRHAVKKEFSCNAAQAASCNTGMPYLGSHDAFVWHVDRDFSEDMLKTLDVVPNSNGIENVLIWYFREKMQYMVTNPCKHLIIYHNHCMPIRNTASKRFNRKGKNGLATFTDAL